MSSLLFTVLLAHHRSRVTSAPPDLLLFVFGCKEKLGAADVVAPRVVGSVVA
jgi:hypothetical protein